MTVRPPVPQTGDDEGSTFVELALYIPMTNTVPEAPPTGPDQMLVYKTTSTDTRRMVTQRDDDLLTPEETRQRWRGVEAAMLKELTLWHS